MNLWLQDTKRLKRFHNTFIILSSASLFLNALSCVSFSKGGICTALTKGQKLLQAPGNHRLSSPPIPFFVLSPFPRTFSTMPLLLYSFELRNASKSPLFLLVTGNADCLVTAKKGCHVVALRGLWRGPPLAAIPSFRPQPNFYMSFPPVPFHLI